jgi:hypothetical protein
MAGEGIAGIPLQPGGRPIGEVGAKARTKEVLIELGQDQ